MCTSKSVMYFYLDLIIICKRDGLITVFFVLH